MTAAPAVGLASKSVGPLSLFFFGITASAPMTVLAGAVIATYGGTGVIGVPLSFLALTVALAFFTVGFVALARRIPHAGSFYAFLANGLGGTWGVAGAALTLVSYNSIQVCLYGLFGATVSGLLGGTWWLWSLIAWAVVAALGVLHIDINAKVLGVVLVTELLVIVLFDIAAFTSPADGTISFAPLAPSNLLVDGIGGVFALGVASFIGYESAAVYSEEARRSHTSVPRAAFGTLVFLGILYTVSSWALAVAVGPDNVAAASADPNSGLPFSVLTASYGGSVGDIAVLLLIASVFGALLSFHNTVARYVFGIAREQVLPQRLMLTIGSRGAAPVGGSLLQSAIALLAIGVFAATGADPVTVMFTWLATLAAIGVLTLMVLTSIAVVRFFARGGGTGEESVWQTVLAPIVGFSAMAVILGVTVLNLGSLLGAVPGSQLPYLLPAIILGCTVLGLSWGLWLRSARPDSFAVIGRGRPKALAVVDRSLRHLEH